MQQLLSFLYLSHFKINFQSNVLLLQIFILFQLFIITSGFDFCDTKNISNITFSKNKINPFSKRAFYKAYHEARWVSNFYSKKEWSKVHKERSTTFLELYIKFLQTNIDHLIVFLLPIILFVLTLIFSLRQFMKSCKELTIRHRLIKRKYIHMAVIAAKYKKRMEKAESLLQLYK